MVGMFRAKQGEGRSKVEAVISRSTKGMRALFQDSSCGLKFTMPHAPDLSPVQASDRHSRELKDLGQASHPSY